MFFNRIRILKAPSIALQKIILVVFFSSAAAAVWWQNSKQALNYPAQQFTAAALPEGVADLDLSAAEAAWSDLVVDSQGALKINAQAELALSEVIAVMSEEAFDLQMKRMAFLIEKQFGAAISEQLAALIPALKDYKNREQRWWDENGKQVPPAYAELFQLQDEVLGKALAKNLFSEQRRLANIMLAGYHIQNDASLTQAQKDQALGNLQSHFGGGVNE